MRTPETPRQSPEFSTLLAGLWASPLPDDLAEMRSAYEQMGAQFAPAADVATHEARLGGRQALWFEPTQGAEPGVVLYFHGGGFAIGSIASHRHMGDALATHTRRRAVLLDYRLAPEHPFPSGLDDATAAYAELVGEGHPVALAGDSAGAGLVAATMLRIRMLGLPPPIAAYMVSPWVDLTLDSPTIESKASVDPFCRRSVLQAMADHYLSGGASPHDALVSPIYGSFGADTPVLIQVGSAEALLQDALRLASALGEGNADVELQVWSQMIHVWPWFHPFIPEGDQALRDASQFIAACFSR